MCRTLAREGEVKSEQPLLRQKISGCTGTREWWVGFFGGSSAVRFMFRARPFVIMAECKQTDIIWRLLHQDLPLLHSGYKTPRRGQRGFQDLYFKGVTENWNESLLFCTTFKWSMCLIHESLFIKYFQPWFFTKATKVRHVLVNPDTHFETFSLWIGDFDRFMKICFTNWSSM